MKLPIDTAGITFLAAGAPEPALDYDTKAAKVDESGQPKGVTQGTALKLVGLTAQPWSMGDRSGVAFRAAHIEAAGPARPAS